MTKEHARFVADVIATFMVGRLMVRGERVAVVRDPSEEKIGSIILAPEAQRKEPRGTIVAVGGGVDDNEDIQVGDRVMYTKYSPIHFTINLPTGEKADVELFHISDIYITYADGDVEDECDGQ